jgi:hydroxyacylglutathione hydrolase
MKTWKTKSGYEITCVLSGRSNVFLLSNGKLNILIDTSVKRLYPRLIKQLDTLNVQTLDYLILTHAHFDHAANAFSIKEQYHAKILIHKNEAEYLFNGDNIVPNGITVITKFMMNTLGKKIFPLFKYHPCLPDLVTDNYFDLKEMGFNACLIHTPGHTSGSLSLVIDNEIAVVGDAMFGVFKNSVHPPYAENEKIMIKSWGKLLETQCTLFLPAHGSANSRLLVQQDYDKRIKTIK